MTKTQTAKKSNKEKRNLFGLSGKQLKLVVGGSGVIEGAPQSP